MYQTFHVRAVRCFAVMARPNKWILLWSTSDRVRFKDLFWNVKGYACMYRQGIVRVWNTDLPSTLSNANASMNGHYVLFSKDV